MPISRARHAFAMFAINAAPEAPGLYALYAGELLIYLSGVLGRGASIRSRLLDHFEGRLLPAEATHFNWEITRKPAQRQAELLNELEAVGHIHPCFNLPFEHG